MSYQEKQAGLRKARKRRARTLKERLEQKTDKLSSSPCWIWIGKKTPKGYGRIHTKIECVGNYAHRLAYFVEYGEIPSEMYVCHTCDNPSCVNPDHLFLGSPKDNAIDRDNKGRGRVKPGELNPKNRLTENQVNEIIKKYATGDYSQRKLSLEYGVCHQHISDIVLNKRWKRR